MFVFLPLCSLRRSFWRLLSCWTFLSCFSDWGWTKAGCLL